MDMNSLTKRISRKISNKILIDYNNNYRATVFLSGVGRSGTTWISNIINYKNEYRDIFEPFLPNKVKEAAEFEYHQYIRPHNRDPKFLNPAKIILSGRFKNSWTDTNNRKKIASKRIIKDIRTNLMLKWIHTNFPDMPIVLLLRHPCAVANSWLRLHWGKEVLGTRTDLDICLSQQELMEDFLEPFKSNIENAKDDFEKHIFLWCILNYVPLRQFKRSEIHLAFYEEFCENPMLEIDRLFSFLGKKTDEKVFKNLNKPSSESRKDSEIMTGGSLTDGWRDYITVEQIQSAVNILSLFGLDSIYSHESMPNIDNAKMMISS